MKFYFQILLISIAIFTIIGCELDVIPVEIPEHEPSELKGTSKVSSFIKNATEGLYVSNNVSKPFGDTIVLKWSQDILSVFTGKNTTYMVLNTGTKADEIIFEGYWRNANSNETGAVLLKISSENGAKELLKGTNPLNIMIAGIYDRIAAQNLKDFAYRRIDDLNPGKENYRIIAHKGGGRNFDRLPHSENSIELIKYCSYLGANSVELDVQLSKDKIPVLFHDNYLSLRTVNNQYLIGKVSDYYLKQLQQLTTLKYGELIPTLDKALDAIIMETELKLVWLDVKNPDAIALVKPIQQKYIEKSAQLGRNVEILIGLSTADVLNRFKESPDYNTVPSLCELDENDVIDVGALAWAPRWSMGLLNERVRTIQSLGKRAFVWTIDDLVLIKKFINESNFDGIVTNYSPVVAYEYYKSK
ncbi:MAG: hypothetical protein CVV22_12530 [Ignavibacteriae bacterium HGW-Ignavibacteriae-1]|jgi:glycerophosphoryl diester phosphodiesterase|nr:MAG: hypothetical protein CVV22_12530 [Ignavibacteriae bacterium HGW-Ignavibacteriae-1]